jgi:hypothetical protein
MSLQKSTISCMPSFAKVLRSAKVSWDSHSTTAALALCEPG